MDERERALRQDGTLIGLALAGLVNGSHFSPWFDLFALPIASVISGFFFGSPLLTFYFVSLCVSVFTVLIAGVPAAIYESNKGLTESSATSLTIWLMAAILLSLPALAKMIGFW
jgi:phage tail protein X